MPTYTRGSIGRYTVRNTYTRTTTGRTWYSPIPFISVALVNGSWLFTWATGTGPVRVVLWGKQIDEVTDNFYSYKASSMWASTTTAPPLEIWPAGVPAISQKNQPYLVLQWYRVACKVYQIQRHNGTSWVLFTTVTDSVSIPIQIFTTQVLPDEQEAQWRVIAVDVNKRTSTPVTYTANIVRPPDVPAALVLACTGGTLSVS